jgi:hypothetical protein
MSQFRDINAVDFADFLEHNIEDSIIVVNSIAVIPVKSVTVSSF